MLITRPIRRVKRAMVRAGLRKQVTMLIQSGFALDQGFYRLAHATGWPRARRDFLKVAQALEAGGSLATAMRGATFIMPRELRATLDLDPSPGTIAAMLELYCQREADWREEVSRGRMRFFYIATVALVVSGVMKLLISKVLPVTMNMYCDVGSPLPRATTLLNDFVYSWPISGPTILLCFVILLPVLTFWHRYLPWNITRLFPVAGHQDAAWASRVVATCLQAGEQLPRAIALAAAGTSRTLREDLSRVAGALAEGINVEKTLTEARILPGPLRWYLSRSLSPQALGDALEQVGVLYQVQAEAAWSRWLEWVEFFGLIILGGLVCWIAVAILAPLFQLPFEIVFSILD